jgi:tetratricopeptide (TPR) repeat protein
MQDQLPIIDTLLAKREIRKAEVLIAKLLRLDPAHSERVQLLTRRARTRLLNARPDDAIDDLLSIRTENDDSPSLLELLGDCYFERFELASVGFADRQDTVQAERAYREILDRFPDYDNAGWVYYQLGRVLLTQRQIEPATSCFQQALLNPSHLSALTAFCYERLGFIAFYETRDLNKALTFLSKAVDTYPASESRIWLVQVHILKSRVLREMRRYEMALQAAETALTVASESGPEHKTALAEALLTTGELLSDMGGREKDVVACLQQFLQITKKPLGVDVTWSRVHEMLGETYFRLEQHESAVSAYYAALQFNPDHPWETSIYYRIARSYYQQHAYEKSIEAIRHMLKAAETEGQAVNDYRVYDILGNAQFALKQYDKAAEAYQTALRIAPPNAEDLDKIKMYWQYAEDLS